MTRPRAARIALLALPTALVVTTVAAWLYFRAPEMSPAVQWLAGSIGDLLALVGLIGLAIMVAMGTRFPWVERAFGLDRIYRFHKVLGVVVFGAFVGHALLRTLQYSLHRGGRWQWSFLFYFSARDPALLVGHLAIYALILLIPLAVIGRHRIPFRLWKSAHLLLYAVVALGFVHAWVKGSDEFKQPPNLAVFAVLAASLLVLCLYRLSYRIGRDRRGTWFVAGLVPETHDTTTLVLSRPEGPGSFARRRAGQFAVIRVRQGKRWSEPHPFTISAPPGSGDLRFTIKAAGRFTSAVPSLEPGAEVLCEGPYGIFTVDLGSGRDIAMISGGVGVTPFLSHIRHVGRVAPEVCITLLCANRTAADIIAREELGAAAGTMKLRIVHVLSHTPPEALPDGAPSVAFESGRVTADLLARHVPSADVSFYLCGPPQMQAAVLRALEQTHGVKPSHVRRELFFY